MYSTFSCAHVSVLQYQVLFLREWGAKRNRLMNFGCMANQLKNGFRSSMHTRTHKLFSLALVCGPYTCMRTHKRTSMSDSITLYGACARGKVLSRTHSLEQRKADGPELGLFCPQHKPVTSPAGLLCFLSTSAFCFVLLHALTLTKFAGLHCQE
jgi:hypothetical protein